MIHTIDVIRVPDVAPTTDDSTFSAYIPACRAFRVWARTAVTGVSDKLGTLPLWAQFSPPRGHAALRSAADPSAKLFRVVTSGWHRVETGPWRLQKYGPNDSSALADSTGFSYRVDYSDDVNDVLPDGVLYGADGESLPRGVFSYQPGANANYHIATATRGVQIYDTTSASGAALDTGVLDVRGYSQLLGIVDGTARTVDFSGTLYAARDDGSLAQDSSITIPAGNSRFFNFGLSAGAFSWVVAHALWPKLKITTGASGTGAVRLTIWGR